MLRKRTRNIFCLAGYAHMWSELLKSLKQHFFLQMNLWTDPLDAELVNDAVSATGLQDGCISAVSFQRSQNILPFWSIQNFCFYFFSVAAHFSPEENSSTAWMQHLPLHFAASGQQSQLCACSENTVLHWHHPNICGWEQPVLSILKIRYLCFQK